jgi:hypothetical protein
MEVDVVVWPADDSPTGVAATFAAVGRVVREWRNSGRTTTTAGVKSALQREIPGGFDETSLGFADFRSFLRGGATAGYFHLEKLPTGHWLILLPGETLAQALAAREEVRAVRNQEATEVGVALPSAEASPARNAPASGAFPTALAESQRLRADVWSAFVDWRTAHRRLWDRRVGRAFAYPVNGDGRPSWEAEPARFAAIAPANEAVQINWMREWAATLPTPDRDKVSQALQDDAPRGEFRRQLSSLGLLADWRAELQRRVTQFVAQWATQHEVSLTELIDQRSRPREQSRAGSPPEPPPPSDPGERSDVAWLRAKLHRIIDLMPLSELVELEIPAQYLLLDRK